MRWLAAIVLVGFTAWVGETSPAPYTQEQPTERAASAEGLAAYLAQSLAGRRMASGERYDPKAMVAAHPTYPFGTLVQVTNLENGRSVRVRILDRGPTARSQARGVIIDLSRAAAEALGAIRQGLVRVRVDVLPSKAQVPQ
jgi:rare lipoprotein A